MLLIVVSLMVSGCNTLKGAQEGFKQDWKEWNKADGWIQKNMW